MMHVTGILPDLDGLSIDAAVAVARRIRAELRPGLLGRLAGPTCARLTPALREALAADIAALDTYATILDQRILREAPPAPAQLWRPVYRIVRKEGCHYVEADTALFFSAESLTNVHGPVMLLHACALGMELAREGETVTGVRKVAFKKLVTRPLRLFVYDDETVLPAATLDLAEQASVAGRLVLDTGRMLGFFGVQRDDGVVTDFANFNSLALQLLAPGLRSELEDGVYTLKLSMRLQAHAVPPGGLTPALTMMTMLDLWMLMFLALPFNYRTKLLLGFQQLDALPDPAHMLRTATALQCKPDFRRGRVLGSGMTLVPAGFRLLPHDTAWRRAHIALGTEPYYASMTPG